jgi:hypothetical protein
MARPLRFAASRESAASLPLHRVTNGSTNLSATVLAQSSLAAQRVCLGRQVLIVTVWIIVSLVELLTFHVFVFEKFASRRANRGSWRRPGSRCRVLEREPDSARRQSGWKLSHPDRRTD